ncbi:U2 snRNP component IST3, partial [Phytophthora palmivora]
DEDKERKQRGLPGHAYEGKELATDFDLHKGVDKRRQEQRLKEEKEAMQGEEEVPLPSVTGWRGRLEPSAARPRHSDRQEEREKREDKSFGGMRRVR